jgi:hypothetical protein
MVSGDMVDWSLLKDSTGDASAVPALLAEASSGPDSQAWNLLWPRLSDAGGVYPASYAALPALAEMAGDWPAAEAAVMPLSLAGSIVSHAVGPQGVDPFTEYASTISELHRLTDRAMRSPDLEFWIYKKLLLNLISFEGCVTTGTVLDYLDGVEYEVDCENCDTLNYVSVDAERGYSSAIAPDYIYNPETRTVPLTPIKGPALQGLAKHLFDRAQQDGRADVSEFIENFFGRITCANCGFTFDIGSRFPWPCR